MRKHLKYLRKEKGMTLVELLAVLVILGIVAAIAVPLIGNIIKDSEAKATVNDALTIIAAAKLAHTNGDSDFNTETDIDTLADKKYLDADLKTTYSGVTVKLESDEWKLKTNKDIKDAVNRLADNSLTGDYITEKQLLKALEKEDITTN